MPTRRWSGNALWLRLHLIAIIGTCSTLGVMSTFRGTTTHGNITTFIAAQVLIGCAFAWTATGIIAMLGRKGKSESVLLGVSTIVAFMALLIAMMIT